MMMRLPLATAALAASAILAAHSFAEEATEISKPNFTVFDEAGYFVKGVEQNSTPFADLFVNRTGAFLNWKAKRENGLSLDLMVGGMYWNANALNNGDATNYQRNFTAMIPRFDISKSWGEGPTPWLRVDAGVFQYKYNEFSHDLGEYLFRTNAYPGLVFNGGLTYVDANTAQVTGFKATHAPNAWFSHDLLVTLETEISPTWDVNVSYLAKVNLGGILKMGAGAEFARLLPVRPSHTNPDVEENRYFDHNGVTYVDRKDYYDKRIQGVIREKNPTGDPTVVVPDTAAYNLALAVIDSVDKGTLKLSVKHFDASAIKPVAYFAFDPKPLFGNPESMGANDFVLYGEAIVLGAKSYPILYDDIQKRIPIMIGFNLPTFKLLDVFTVEFEHYGSQFPNSNFLIQTNAIPVSDGFAFFPQPQLPNSAPGATSKVGYIPSEWNKDDNRWALFAKRRLMDGVALSLQVASDNSRDWLFPSGRQYFTIFQDPSQWYWMTKLTANF